MPASIGLQWDVSACLFIPSFVGIALSWKAIMASFVVILGSILFAVVTLAQDDFQQKCLDFTPETHIAGSERRILEFVAKGTTLSFPGNDASCSRPSQMTQADLCRLALTIPTSSRSSVIFEMWLPVAWSGRYLATGNGGIDGCIKYEDLAYATQYGFATTGSNNGHNGTGGLAFDDNADIVADFAYRSLHVNVEAGKKLASAFYEKSPTRSYYLGCSQGGRQGTHAAEIYPHDFDGILAGCPALNANYLSAWRGSFYVITGPSNASDFIKSSTWTGLIHNEILKQCDGLDGAVDGIMEDASACNFRPEALLCGSRNATNCLSAPQVKVVRAVYSPWYGEQGQLIYPGLQPGAETAAVARLLSGTPFAFSVDWFRYVVYSDPDWDPASLTIHDATTADNLNPFDIRTWPTTLSTFQSRGGKLIHYHGSADNQISGFNTENFYNRISTGMHQPANQLDNWYRFFRIGGMNHCSGGPGAWNFGQGGSAGTQVPWDPKVNMLAAMVTWVEDGIPPDTVLGTKFINDTIALGVQFQRRHCRYPFRNRFVGGDHTQPDSWECV